MKKIGLIGGTSWHSTVEYYRKINANINEVRGSGNNCEIILYSIDLSLMIAQDWSKIEGEFIRIARLLETMGADAIALCANSTHKVAQQVENAISIPFLHIGDAIRDFAGQFGMRKLGLLGTYPTMVETFLLEKIASKGDMECIWPNHAHLDIVHSIVVDELVRGKFEEDSRQKLMSIMDEMLDRGADGMVLGCTELPILFEGVDYKVPLINTLEVHVNQICDFVMS